MVLLPLPPRAMVSEVGEALNVKEGGAATVSVTVVFAVRLPEVPMMVTVAVALGALAAAVNVTVVWPVLLDGLNEAVTPLGRPEAENATVPLKLP